MRVVNAESARVVAPSMFLHGITGHGKSTWATQGGTPLVILLEAKAESVLRQINPNAVGLVPESLDDLLQLLEMLGKPEKTEKFDRIVLDSFTELTTLAPRWIQQRAGRTGSLTKLELSEYGDLRDYALSIVRAIQLTGKPSVIIGRSTSKRIGLSERIVPDGTGRAVDELPGKLLPTAEARFDTELGYVIDTTPADHSQRCGLPWIPPIYKGSCLDYLRMTQAGPTGEAAPVQASASPAPAPAPEAPKVTEPEKPKTQPQAQPKAEEKPVPGADDLEWVDLITRYSAACVHLPLSDRTAAVAEWEKQYATDAAAAKAALLEYLAAHARVLEIVPDPEQDPAGYRAAFGKVVAELQAEKIEKSKSTTQSQAVTDFVDGVSPKVAEPNEIQDVLDLVEAKKVNIEALWAYAIAKQQAKPGNGSSKNWLSCSEKWVATVKQQLTGKTATAFVSWLHQTYQKKEA